MDIDWFWRYQWLNQSTNKSIKVNCACFSSVLWIYWFISVLIQPLIASRPIHGVRHFWVLTLIGAHIFSFKLIYDIYQLMMIYIILIDLMLLSDVASIYFTSTLQCYSRVVNLKLIEAHLGINSLNLAWIWRNICGYRCLNRCLKGLRSIKYLLSKYPSADRKFLWFLIDVTCHG